MGLSEQIITLKEQILADSHTKEREEELNKLFKKMERELAKANFKYERIAKEKKALENLLEATIQELDEKNNSLLEINTQLSTAEEELKQNSEELKVLNEGLEIRVNDAVKDIESQKAVIEHKNKHILDSINYAQRIQRAMLLDKEEIDSIIAENFVFFRPKDIVSGDFYWFAQTEKFKFVAVIDCTGHGVPGAFMSLILNDGLNEIIHLRKILEPFQILEHLHQYVTKALRQEGTANRDGADLSICRIDTQNEILTFAGARQSLVFFRDGKLQEIKGSRESIGGYTRKRDETQSFQSHTVSLSEEKLSFYLFSDGYPDQFGGENGNKLLRKNFKKILQDIHQKTMDEQGAHLAKFFNKWKGRRDQLDDVLVIGFKA